MNRIVVLGNELDGTGFARVLAAARCSWSRVVEPDVQSARALASQIRRVGARAARLTPAAIDFRAALATARRSRLVIIGDMKLVGYAMMAAEAELTLRPPILWTTLDGPSVDRRVLESLRYVESVFLPTDDQVEILERMLARGGRRAKPRIECAALPLAMSQFYEIPGARSIRGKRSGLRSEVFENVGPDDFLILNSNFNLTRKRIDLTVAAVARLLPLPGPRVMLCLNMRRAGNSAWDIDRLCSSFGLRDSLATIRWPNVLSDTELNVLYNATDVGLNTSTGEGFGLVNLEHAATSAAQLIPDHSTNAGIWGKYPGRIRASRPLMTQTIGHTESLVDIEQLVAMLALYRSDPKKLRHDGVQARACSELAAEAGKRGAERVLAAALGAQHS